MCVRGSWFGCHLEHYSGPSHLRVGMTALEDMTNEVRKFAEEQMAAINDAYSLLRSALI